MPERAGAALVRLLAIELASFRATGRYGGRHLYSGVATFCNSVDDGVFYRPCSKRCRGVGEVLELAAAWLECDVEAFYTVPKPKPKRRKGAL